MLSRKELEYVTLASSFEIQGEMYMVIKQLAEWLSQCKKRPEAATVWLEGWEEVDA